MTVYSGCSRIIHAINQGFSNVLQPGIPSNVKYIQWTTYTDLFYKHTVLNCVKLYYGYFFGAIVRYMTYLSTKMISSENIVMWAKVSKISYYKSNIILLCLGLDIFTHF